MTLFKRTFNGKVYTKYDFWHLKSDAESHARVLRNKGVKCIIVKAVGSRGQTGYRLYTREAR